MDILVGPGQNGCCFVLEKFREVTRRHRYFRFMGSPIIASYQKYI